MYYSYLLYFDHYSNSIEVLIYIYTLLSCFLNITHKLSNSFYTRVTYDLENQILYNKQYYIIQILDKWYAINIKYKVL